MRRLLLFAALLSLVGLSSAFAASLDTQAEDIDSFSTDVSITVPGPTPFPNIIYIRGGDEVPPGALDLMLPVTNDHVTSKELILSTEAIGQQADLAKFYAWESPVAPAQGYSLTGDITLNLEQAGGGMNRMTAGLFSCPAAAPVSTVTSGAIPCAQLAVGVSPADPAGGEGFIERTVFFDNVSAVVPFGSQLRLKIVNRGVDGAQVLSTEDFTVAWGFLPARQSKLVIVP